MTGEAIVITIPTDPVPKERPRVSAWGPSYTPARTKAYQRAVALHAKSALAAFGKLWSLDGWYKVEVVFRREHARGDIDNVAKSILDGLNKVVWNDDARVVELHVRRLYDGVVGARVRVTQVEAPDGAPVSRPKAKRPAARAKRSTAAATAASSWRNGKAALPSKGYNGGET
jgi:Holliday junction resolvase RusA-like endonuclease